jgi:hypothetical protein
MNVPRVFLPVSALVFPSTRSTILTPPASRVWTKAFLVVVVLFAVAFLAAPLGLRAEEPQGSDSPAKAKTPTFVLFGSTIDLPSDHSTGAANVRTVSKNGFAGTVEYKCALLGSPTEPAPPECGMDPTSAKVEANEQAEPLMFVFGKGTTLPTSITLGQNGSGNSRWLGGGAVLACCLLAGIPARRRGWRAMLPVLLLLAAVGGFTSCVTQPKLISPGTYVFEVRGTDGSDPKIESSATITVNVK